MVVASLSVRWSTVDSKADFDASRDEVGGGGGGMGMVEKFEYSMDETKSPKAPPNTNPTIVNIKSKITRSSTHDALKRTRLHKPLDVSGSGSRSGGDLLTRAIPHFCCGSPQPIKAPLLLSH